MLESEPIIIPIADVHLGDNEQKRYFNRHVSAIRRGKIAEISFWTKYAFEEVKRLHPSVVSFDSTTSFSVNNPLFIYPGNPFELRGKSDTQDLFLIGADVTTVRNIKEYFEANKLLNVDFTLQVLTTYGQRYMPTFSMENPPASPDIFSPEFDEDTHRRFLDVRNALMIEKSIEAYNRLGNRRTTGPIAIVVGTGHIFLANGEVWTNKQIRKDILQNAFMDMFHIAQEFLGENYEKDKIINLIEQLCDAFGTTTIWRLGKRPNQRRLQASQAATLIPVEEQFQSQIITDIIHRAAQNVFGNT